MKILIVINSLKHGGAERQVVTDMNILKKNGADITIAYKNEGELKGQIDNSVKCLHIKALTFFQANVQLYHFLLKHHFDLILSHMYWAHKVSAIPAWLTGHKVVFFEHGLGLWRKWYHLAIIRFISIFAFKVVTVSRAKQQIKIGREKIKAEKLVIIPNCYNSLPRLEVQQKRNDYFRICYTGRFAKVKQLHLLPVIAKKLEGYNKKFEFLMLGDGEERINFLEQLEQAGVAKFFRLPGYVQEPQKFMVQSDIFILPSKREDFSVALLEASSVGLPCLAFDVGGNSEIIQDGKTGFIIPPFDVEMMAEKILYLMQHADIRDKMGNEARKFVAANFSETKRFERLNSLINEAI